MTRFDTIVEFLGSQPYPFVLDTKMAARTTTLRNKHGFSGGKPVTIPGKSIVAVFLCKHDMVWMNTDYTNEELVYAYNRLMKQKEIHDKVHEKPDDNIFIITKRDLPKKPSSLLAPIRNIL